MENAQNPISLGAVLRKLQTAGYLRSTKPSHNGPQSPAILSCITVSIAATICLLGCRPAAPSVRQAPVVRVAEATISQTGLELRLSGTIEPDRSTNLSFAVVGTIREVLVSEGAVVERGQILARLDGHSYEDALAIAQAKTDQAQDAYRRMEPMHKNGTIPEIKWVEVESGLRQVQHSLSLARKNLEDTVLRAPEAGIIAKRNAEVGANVAPGLPTFILIQSRVVLATAALPEREAGSARPGQPARVVVGALKRSFSGTIREVGVTADPLTRTYPVKVEVENPDGILSVGMVADVYLRQESANALVTVPPEAVRLDEDGKTYVYILTDGVVNHRSVEVAGYSAERLAIMRGLAAGEQVVISGTSMLSDGIRVRGQQQKGEK